MNNPIKKSTVIGMGEVLWDLLHDEKLGRL